MEFRYFLIFLPPNPLEDLTPTLSAFSLVTGERSKEEALLKGDSTRQQS